MKHLLHQLFQETSIFKIDDFWTIFDCWYYKYLDLVLPGYVHKNSEKFDGEQRDFELLLRNYSISNEDLKYLGIHKI